MIAGNAFTPDQACPICQSFYTLYVQDVLGNRTKQMYPQRYCMDCQSFFHKSSYVEDAEQKSRDFEYLFERREMHYTLMNQLLLEIKTRLPHARTLCELGHGLGMFMKAAQDYGMTPRGFEVSQPCHDFVRSQLMLPCHHGYFDRTHAGTYDLIAAIMVFEHLESPRELFATMRDRLNPDGAIYLTVPFVAREHWPYLRTAGTSPVRTTDDPFYDNDVHITHFSVEGMRRMGLGLGARTAEYWISKDVYSQSPGSYHGILFRF